MPKLIKARVPQDAEEEPKIFKLAGSRHAPGDWIFRACIISLSWQGVRTAEIAEKLNCHSKTLRRRINRFNADGIDGLGDRSGARRSPRITEDERSRIIALGLPSSMWVKPNPCQRSASTRGACTPRSCSLRKGARAFTGWLSFDPVGGEKASFRRFFRVTRWSLLALSQGL